MTASVPPRGAAPSAVRSGSVSRDVAAHAFSNLAALAARVSGTPSVQINIVQGDVSRQVASFGNETGVGYTYQTVIPVNDELGRILGTLCLFDSVVTEVSQDQSQILAGLASQAAALIQLGGDSPRHIPNIEEQFEAILELIPDAIIMHAKGKVTFVNSALLKLSGTRNASDVVGKPVASLFAPETREAVENRVQESYQGEPPTARRTLRFRRHDGKEIPLEVASMAVMLAGEEVRLVVARDVSPRMEAAENLRESEEKYRKLVEVLPDVIAIMVDGKITFINRAGIQFIGAEDEKEILGRPALEFFHPDSREVVIRRLQQLDLGEEIQPMEHKFLRKDGTSIEAESRAISFPYQGHRAKLAVIRDITARKKAELALRTSEERYRTLAAVSPVGLYRTDIQGRYTYVNDHVCGLLGRSNDQMLGLAGIVFIHPHDCGWVTETWEMADAAGVPFQAEYRILNSNGRIFWVMGSALADKDSDGKPIGYIGTISDITERKEAEILLACQKRTLAMVASGWHLHDVLDSLVNYVEKESSGAYGCVLQLDAESKRLVWLAARSIPESFRNQAPSVPLHHEGGALGWSAIAKEYAFCPDIAADEGWTDGASEALANGLKTCSSMPILGSFGQVLGVFAFFYPKAGEPAAYDIKLLETASALAAIAMERRRQEDISRKNQELSEQNLRIQEASRMKSEFLANMSHELRTPLNAIIGFSQLLIDRKVGQMNEKQTEYLGDILAGGMHLLRLINGVLDLAKIEAGKMQLFQEETHVLLAMREVCDILMPMALEKDVTLHCSADPEGESGILDGGKIRQVLYNLVSNAIKFSKQGGKVTVVSGPDGNGGILLRIIDQGIGIRKDDIPKLFRQFQQLDSGSSRHYPGSGLGLVITKKLVELHGGTVEVESVFGEGSIFSAVFPRFAGYE
ncbi:MAG: PAS domain S-box protein [Fibrobacterota bacterium]|nr:PAS domain S-box protein [Fibrobacterota bacterium]